MELQTFAGIVSDRVRREMGDDYHISVVTNLKNNDSSQTGILFVREDAEFSPTIYINDLLEPYRREKKSMSAIVQEVIRRYEESVRAVGDVHQLDVELEPCRQRVIYRLISRERNRRMLEDVPSIPFLDMDITFHIIVSISKKYIQTIRIDRRLQKRWGVSVEQLLKMAKENTEKMLPLEISDLNQMVARHIGADATALSKDDGVNMIVITNSLGIYGASAVLYEDVMQSLSEELDCDLFVVPSSVHEMIVVPANDSELYEVLSSLVREINQQFVEPDEVLSDRVYVYHRKDRKFTASPSRSI